MSGQEVESTLRQRLAMLFWPALLLILLLTISALLQWFLSIELDDGFWTLLSYGWLLVALVVQCLVAMVVVLMWRRNLQLHGVSNVSLRQAVAMIGINSIGKYSPGKVLGILARGAALYRMHGDGRLALQSTLVEQIAMLHSGAMVAVVAWLVDSDRQLLGVLVLGLGIVSVRLVAQSGESLVTVVARYSKKQVLCSGAGPGFERSYVLVFLGMILVWLLSALALYCCVLTFQSGQTAGFLLLLWVLTLAYVAGFVAFFLPAGLGAREGVLLVFLGISIEPGVAAYIAVLHRFITLLVDMLLGAGALMYGKDLAAKEWPSQSI